MPCPAFYPTLKIDQPTWINGRLPLIDEYGGVCKAEGNPYHPDRGTLLRCCNHGYSDSACSRLPVALARSCVRYTVLGRTAAALSILCVEELDYEPRQWRRFEYLPETAEVVGDVPTECIRAQAVAFCKAYLRHFSPSTHLNAAH